MISSREIALPKFVKVHQRFPVTQVENVEKEVADQFASVNPEIKPGAQIGITAGSRGICNMSRVIAQLVKEVKDRGGVPFIIPAMGSHGGATAEGQKEVLAGYGITEETMGAPIRATMEVVEIGSLEGGQSVYMDKYAMEADGLIVVNRIKPHTDFHGLIESGLMKVMAIGLGKKIGAESIHAYGVYGLKNHIPQVARVMLEKSAVIMGLGLVENAYDKTAKIIGIAPEKIEETEKQVVVDAKELMPKLPFDRLDLLVVNEIGKNISGTGMDTNIIGRLQIRGEKEPESPFIYRIVALDLTEESHGNATGIGLADAISQKLSDKVDKSITDPNIITSGFLSRGAIPVTLPSDEETIKVAIQSCANPVPPEQLQMVIIKNTLELAEIYVSEGLLEQVRKNDILEVEGELRGLHFNDKGNLTLFD